MAIKASWVLQNRRYPLPGRQAFGLAGAPSLCRRGIISRFGIGVSGNEHHLARTQCLHRGYSEEFKRKITPHGVGHIVRRKLGLKTPSRTMQAAPCSVVASPSSVRCSRMDRTRSTSTGRGDRWHATQKC